MERRQKTKKSDVFRVIALAAVTGVVLAFQACSDVGFNSLSTPSSANQSISSGGEGLDGKAYANFGACPDGKLDVVAKLVINKGGLTASILRENCQDLQSPTQISVSNLKFASQSASVLTLNERVFDAIVAAGAQPTTVALCESVGVTPVVEARIWQMSDNLTNLFGEVRDSNGLSTGTLPV